MSRDLELRAVRLNRNKHTVLFFSEANSAGEGIKIDADSGTLWFHMNGEKTLIHSRSHPGIEWADGVKAWVQNGLYHRKDGPALEYNGFEGREDIYYINGIELTKSEFDQANRQGIEPVDEGFRFSWVQESTSMPSRADGGPAVIWQDGKREWYKDGLRDRFDGPAITWPDGSYAWYRRGVLDRVSGPATEGSDGAQGWFINGRKHRNFKDGPAITHSDGGQEYWWNNQKHNPLGPAIIYPEGDVEYWNFGKKLTKEEWEENNKAHLRGIVLDNAEREIKSAIKNFVGSNINEKTTESVNLLVEKTLKDLMIDAEDIRTEFINENTVETRFSIPQEFEQLEFEFKPTNEKAESSDVSVEEKEAGWGTAATALLIAAGMKGVQALTSTNEESVHVEEQVQETA